MSKNFDVSVAKTCHSSCLVGDSASDFASVAMLLQGLLNLVLLNLVLLNPQLL